MKETHFTTQAGYKAHVLFVNDSHYCGYVEIEKDHPAYGLNYYTGYIDIEDIDESFIKKLPVLKALNEIYVHGGLTYADKSLKGVQSTDSWFFGFDAAHYDDKTKYSSKGTFRDLAYMRDQCELLADQLKSIENSKEIE